MWQAPRAIFKSFKKNHEGFHFKEHTITASDFAMQFAQKIKKKANSGPIDSYIHILTSEKPAIQWRPTFYRTNSFLPKVLWIILAHAEKLCQQQNFPNLH